MIGRKKQVKELIAIKCSMNSPFKKSSISEMCKQISSAPVIFKKNSGEECLAFYNNEDITQATKLYILFPGTSFPKYIEGNDLFTLKDCIFYEVTAEKATQLYNQSNKTHKMETQQFIYGLIAKSHFKEVTIPSKINIQSEHSIISEEYISNLHVVYNKKHACGWVKVANVAFPTMAIMKDLNDKTASEVIIGNTLKYNVTFDSVYWAASISSKEFTDYKVKLKI